MQVRYQTALRPGMIIEKFTEYTDVKLFFNQEPEGFAQVH